MNVKGLRAQLTGLLFLAKGRPPVPNRLFFLTLFKRPLTPPLLVFEHLCCGLYRGLWRQIAPRSIQNLQKNLLNMGLTPPRFEQLKKKTDDLVRGGVPKH